MRIPHSSEAANFSVPAPGTAVMIEARKVTARLRTAVSVVQARGMSSLIMAKHDELPPTRGKNDTSIACGKRESESCHDEMEHEKRGKKTM